MKPIDEDARNWVLETRLRLTRRRAEKPATKAGQIRAVWPEIAAALEGGQSLKSIRQWLEEDAGIVIGLTSLTSYISRIRRRELRIQDAQKYLRPKLIGADHVTARVTQTAISTDNAQPIESASKTDPIAQAMRALSKPRLDIRKLHADGDPTGKNLV